MPDSITSYTTFIAGTKARSTLVNANFSNYRGSYLPINTDTATASDAEHDLGKTDHRFRDLHLSRDFIFQGATFTGLPIGTIIPYVTSTAPAGFLSCDGASVNRSTYTNLFDIIGVNYGSGDTTTEFNVPDLRGRFIRGQDDGAAVDPDAPIRTALQTGGSTGDSIGSAQAYQDGQHGHGITDPGHFHTMQQRTTHAAGGATEVSGGQGSIVGNPVTASKVTGLTVNTSTGNESRPINVYVGFFIRF